jgi:hypothetical protein
MFHKNQNRKIIFILLVIAIAGVGTSPSTAASRPAPKPSPAPAPKPVSVPDPAPAVAPKPSPVPAPKPVPAPALSASPSQSISSQSENQVDLVRKVFENPIVEAVTLTIANRSTLTPTLIQGPASVVQNIGGFGQIAPTLVTVAKSSGPSILAIVATLARGAAYG